VIGPGAGSAGFAATVEGIVGALDFGPKQWSDSLVKMKTESP
jgi:hypothetical protein